MIFPVDFDFHLVFLENGERDFYFQSAVKLFRCKIKI